MLHKKPLTWIEVSKEAFNNNINFYKSISGSNVALAAVIKGNAYGHGFEQIATLCNNNNNVDWLCTVSLSEALILRSYGITKPILALSIIDADISQAIIHDINFILYDETILDEINTCAQLLHKKAYVHIKVDTGLSRLGILVQSAFALIAKVTTYAHIAIQGIFSHFADAENDNLTFAQIQLHNFNTVIKSLETNNIQIPYKHVSCSAAIGALPDCRYNLVRSGIGLYGLWPSEKNKKIMQQHYNNPLQSVLTWKTTIIQIKEIPECSSIGYDRTYQTTRKSIIAILPIGYWDGYNRLLSNKGHVLINNNLAPIRGTIAMNMMMVDITDFAHKIKVGDEVIVLGNYELINADVLAQKCNTINYEIVTRINPLLPRIIV